MILALGKTRANRHTPSGRRFAKSFDPMAKARILPQMEFRKRLARSILCLKTSL